MGPSAIPVEPFGRVPAVPDRPLCDVIVGMIGFVLVRPTSPAVSIHRYPPDPSLGWRA